ncbi:MAG: hypothetical protein P8X58_01370 [Syntrophobacterales bacterium]
MTEKISGRPRRRWLLINMVAMLVVILAPGLAPAALTVDGYYEMTTDIHYDFETIGFQSQGTLDHLGGLINEVDYNLVLGNNSTASGTYNLSSAIGGRVARLSANNEYIGLLGTGTFNHDGGNNTITADLYLGHGIGGTGTYMLERGSLSAANQYIGYGGTGTFDQDISDPITSNTITEGLYLGKTSTGKGTYELGTTGDFRGGATLEAANEYIGDEGRGIFYHHSSANTITANLYLGYAGTGTGTYNLGDPRFDKTPQLSADKEFIGYEGSGTFNHDRGDNTVTGDLSLGRTSTGTGTYTLLDGSLSANKEFIGYNGSGVFIQEGGNNSIIAGFHLGRNPNGQGTYELSDGTLTAAREFIGNEGTGAFTQTGGKNTVTEHLNVANQDGSSGVYNLEGGTLSADTINLKTGGTFNQTGGQWEAAFHQNGGNVEGTLKNLATSSFTYTSGDFKGRLINRGIVTFNNDFVAENGLAQYSATPLIVDGGRIITLEGQGLDVDQGAGFTLRDGRLNAPYETIGVEGGGSFTQEGGSNIFIPGDFPWSSLSLGAQDTGTGSYDLKGGFLSVDNEYIGGAGSGVFNHDGGDNTAETLLVGFSSNGTGTYNLNHGSLSSLWQFIGDLGTGTFTQSGGTNTVTETLTLARQMGGSGEYDLNNGSLSAGTIELGTQGTFNQTGGTVDFSVFDQAGGVATFTDLSLGSISFGSTSSYTLSGGRNTVSGDIAVEFFGTYYLQGGRLEAVDEYVNSGYFGYLVRLAGNGFRQSGGTNTLTGSLFLNSESYYKLGGSGSVLRVGGDLDVGDDHLAYGILYGCLFYQTNGTATVTGNLYLGNIAGTLGKYELKSGTLSADKEFIGHSGIGTFTQIGGSNSVIDRFHLGRTSTGSGTYELSDGILRARLEFIGNEGTGVFTQTGGRNTATETLTVARQADSSGVYNLEGGTLWANNINLKTGGAFHQTGGALDFLTFDQLGGTATFTEFNLGEDIVAIPGGPDVDPESTTYSLQDGSFLAPTINLKTGGVFNQTGGTLDFSSFNQTDGLATFTDLYLGINPGSSSSYDLSGGSLSATNEHIRSDFIHSGGSNALTGDLLLGDAGGSSGTYTLSNTGFLNVGGTLKVGGEANGYFTQFGGTLTSGSLVVNSVQTGLANSFTQSGGSHNVSGDITLGRFGTYYLQGGSLGAGDEYVKSGHIGGVIMVGAGAGFRQSGGTNTLSGSLFLNSKSFYELTGNASVLQVGQNLDVGDASTDILGDLYGCLFSQTNGTAHIAGTLYLGNNAGTLGTYELNGGSLSASEEIIGDAGNGIFTQTGGTHAVNALLSLGYGSSGSGAFTLSGGSLAATNEAVGHSGTGAFNQDAGHHSVLGNLYVGRNSGSSGTYTLSGGTQTVSTLFMGENGGSRGIYNLSSGSFSAQNEFIGLFGSATFTQTGGTHSVTSNLLLGTGITSSGTYNLEGGSLSAGTIQINSTGTFNVTGTDTTLTTTVTGNVVNAGTIKTTNADVTWKGTFTNNGVYMSDPATQTFSDLTVGTGGYLVAGAGDLFKVSGDFDNQSTQNTDWDTGAATLQFIAGADDNHNLSITGTDFGPTGPGYTDNFSWDTIKIDLGQNVYLVGSGDAALYVKVITGVDVDSHPGFAYNIYGTMSG